MQKRKVNCASGPGLAATLPASRLGFQTPAGHLSVSRGDKIYFYAGIVGRTCADVDFEQVDESHFRIQ
jgi:hypothetical protein